MTIGSQSHEKCTTKCKSNSTETKPFFPESETLDINIAGRRSHSAAECDTVSGPTFTITAM